MMFQEKQRSRFRALALSAAVLSASAAAAAPVLFPGTGNYYELIGTQTTWADAVTEAAAQTYLGVGGHLATVTSDAENTFLSGTFASGEAAFFAWLGGHEPNDDGVWLWGAGPEDGIQFSQGDVPTAPFLYVNWGGIEPNDFAPGEDYLAINLGATFAGVLPGEWIDSPNPNPSDPIRGFLVEYETGTTGVEGDAGAGPSPGFLFRQASPNPVVGGSMVFELQLPGPSEVTLALYNVIGQAVERRVFSASGGRLLQEFQVEALPPGVYYARVSWAVGDERTGLRSDVKKVTVLR